MLNNFQVLREKYFEFKRWTFEDGTLDKVTLDCINNPNASIKAKYQLNSMRSYYRKNNGVWIDSNKFYCNFENKLHKVTSVTELFEHVIQYRDLKIGFLNIDKEIIRFLDMGNYFVLIDCQNLFSAKINNKDVKIGDKFYMHDKIEYCKNEELYSILENCKSHNLGNHIFREFIELTYGIKL